MNLQGNEVTPMLDFIHKKSHMYSSGGKVPLSTKQEKSRSGAINAPAEWKHPLTGCILGLILFETLTGLMIYLSPFSVFNQFALLLHTLAGLGLVVPLAWYLGRHWLRRFRGAFTHYQLLGYLAAIVLILLVASGILLTWQAAFGPRMSYTWDFLHLGGTFVFIALLGAHLVTLVLRKASSPAARGSLRGAYRSACRQVLAWSGSLFLACGVLLLLYSPPRFDDSFPGSYNFRYGADRPFAPSLARKDMGYLERELKTQILEVLAPERRRRFSENLRVDPNEHIGIVTAAERLLASLDLTEGERSKTRQLIEGARRRYAGEGRVDPRRLAGSKSCGTSGCHDEILAEWEPSAHRYSSMDVVFQRVQEIMVQERDPEVTRYCAGCHDPISLLAGAKRQDNVTLSAEGADEGISCISCHSIDQTDVRGNADYTIQPPVRYIYELHGGSLAKKISDFLIRAYPRHHVASYSRPLYKTTEYCAACHKQFIDEEVNLFGWVQGQNQYDSWRKSRWHDESDPGKTLACRECHMPLVDSRDPASGEAGDSTRTPGDGKHRSHRFLAANQFVPLFHDLPGAREHVELTERWLRGEYEVPEIAHKWTEGPVVRMQVIAPETVQPGESVEIQAVLTNNKAGHDFPTGPLDMIEGWVELTVTDEAGKVVFQSGTLDGREYLINPQIVFKKELIDRKGKLVDRHNLWDAVGLRFGRSLFPGFTDTTRFLFLCPAMTSNPEKPRFQGDGERFQLRAPREGTLTARAVLWYSKFKAPFMDAIFGEERRMRALATAITEAECRIQVKGNETPKAR